MKIYRINVNRTYYTTIELKFPDDDRDHKEIINEKIKEGDREIWDLIAEKELEQMEVTNDNWEISEINNNTITGALLPDTGPRN